MQQFFIWWSTHQAWAGSLDSEARCYIIGACIALLMVYVVIDITSPEGARGSAVVQAGTTVLLVSRTDDVATVVHALTAPPGG